MTGCEMDNKSKFIEKNEEIAEAVTDGFKKIENGVTDGYKKIENGVVSGFTKITDKFVDSFLTKDGESVEDAKKRLAEEQAKREADAKAAAEQRTEENRKRIEAAKKLADR